MIVARLDSGKTEGRYLNPEIVDFETLKAILLDSDVRLYIYELVTDDQAANSLENAIIWDDLRHRRSPIIGDNQKSLYISFLEKATAFKVHLRLKDETNREAYESFAKVALKEGGKIMLAKWDMRPLEEALE